MLTRQAQQECRICLDSHQIGSNQLVAPCLCRGSVKFVHRACMVAWIERKLAKLPEMDKKMCLRLKAAECELCKHKIEFTCEQRLHCRDRDEVLRLADVNFCSLSSLFFSFLTALTVCIFSASNYHEIRHQNPSSMVGNIFLILSIVMALFSSVLVLTFVRLFVMASEDRVVDLACASNQREAELESIEGQVGQNLCYTHIQIQQKKNKRVKNRRGKDIVIEFDPPFRAQDEILEPIPRRRLRGESLEEVAEATISDLMEERP